MKFLPELFQNLGGLLSSPGDKFSAEVTKSGRRVAKLATKAIRHSIVNYPSTGTTVETIVHKKNK